MNDSKTPGAGERSAPPAGSRFRQYHVWMQNCPDRGYGGPWRKTNHSLKARTDKEAQTRMRRMFANFGLSACALIALPDGIDANNVINRN